MAPPSSGAAKDAGSQGRWSHSSWTGLVASSSSGRILGHEKPCRTARARCAVGDRPSTLATPPSPSAWRPPAYRRRPCLPGRVVFMTVTSTPWRLLPALELGCGSPATCWRRFTEWAKAKVIDRLHLELLDELGRRGLVDWSRTSIDSHSLRAERGGSRWHRASGVHRVWRVGVGAAARPAMVTASSNPRQLDGGAACISCTGSGLAPVAVGVPGRGPADRSGHGAAGSSVSSFAAPQRYEPEGRSRNAV